MVCLINQASESPGQKLVGQPAGPIYFGPNWLVLPMLSQFSLGPKTETGGFATFLLLPNSVHFKTMWVSKVASDL